VNCTSRWALALLLLAAVGLARASADDLVVVRLGERSDGDAGTDELEAATVSAQTSGKRVRVVDLRAAGAGLRTIRIQQLPKALLLRPRVVTLSLGSADLCGDTSLRTFARELHVVAELLRRNVHTIVVSSLSPPGETCARGGPRLLHRLEAFNATISQSAQRNRLLTVDARERGDRRRAPDPLIVAQLEGALVSTPSAPSRRPAAPPARDAM
jgi:hypothetical protein